MKKSEGEERLRDKIPKRKNYLKKKRSFEEKEEEIN